MASEATPRADHRSPALRSACHVHAASTVCSTAPQSYYGASSEMSLLCLGFNKTRLEARQYIYLVAACHCLHAIVSSAAFGRRRPCSWTEKNILVNLHATVEPYIVLRNVVVPYKIPQCCRCASGPRASVTGGPRMSLQSARTKVRCTQHGRFLSSSTTPTTSSTYKSCPHSQLNDRTAISDRLHCHAMPDFEDFGRDVSS